MIQAMYNGVSGLKAHKTMMDVIGNNIANINTVSYKSSSVNFKEMFNQTLAGATAPVAGGIGGKNPTQVGLGVSVGSINVNMAQGSTQPTGKPSDCAIDGDGFFILGDGAGKAYSRDGSFTLDGDGNLTSSSSGMRVLGWAVDQTTGILDTTQPVTAASSLRIPLGQLAVARQTTNIAYGGNLDSTTPAGGSYEVKAQVYDSLGNTHDLSLSFTRMSATAGQVYTNTTSQVGTGTFGITVGEGTPVSITIDGTNNTLQGLCDAINASSADVEASIVPTTGGYKLEIASDAGAVTTDTSAMVAGTGTVPTFTAISDARWKWEAASPDAVTTIPVGSGYVSFDEFGKSTVDAFPISLTLSDPRGATSPLEMSVYFPPITQLAGESTLSAISQDGLPLGVLDGYTIGANGIVTGEFSNGQTQTLGQIALAKFSNAAGLSKTGSSLYMETPNSGIPQVGEPSVGSMGKIASGYLEASNVDLSTEFANMIIAQRGFQANSRIITTSDEILQELVQLKR